MQVDKFYPAARQFPAKTFLSKTYATTAVTQNSTKDKEETDVSVKRNKQEVNRKLETFEHKVYLITCIYVNYHFVLSFTKIVIHQHIKIHLSSILGKKKIQSFLKSLQINRFGLTVVSRMRN